MIFTYQLNVFLVWLRFILLARVYCDKIKMEETRRLENFAFFCFTSLLLT